MEGNECYKFSTVKRYIEQAGAKPIRVAVDIGARVGQVTKEMRSYFPAAQIFAFEAVRHYYLEAWAALREDPSIHVFNLAVTSLHVYEDASGNSRRPRQEPLTIYMALPGNDGWSGGSKILPRCATPPAGAYARLDEPVHAITLDDLVRAVTMLADAEEVDFIKSDCEGSEYSCFGSASEETLRKLRFIGGEYHKIGPMYELMREKLFKTHYVNLVGDSEQGSFFCERIGEPQTILNPDKTGMLHLRTWLHPEPLEWHVFRNDFVAPEERAGHGM
ncbi:MAG: hypothetical protein AMXMBFR83_04240 [Phycisphaerae bacterium]